MIDGRPARINNPTVGQFLPAGGAWNGNAPRPFALISMGGCSVSAKDTVVGTAKQIVAEIVADGRLADEGARQSNKGSLRSAGEPAMGSLPPEALKPPPSSSYQLESQHMDESQFASLLGRAALKVWPDLPRDAQEQLFAAAVDDGLIANGLAEFLHDRHPRTVHPPRPTRLA